MVPLAANLDHFVSTSLVPQGTKNFEDKFLKQKPLEQQAKSNPEYLTSSYSDALTIYKLKRSLMAKKAATPRENSMQQPTEAKMRGVPAKVQDCLDKRCA